jgi:hypothetical protein
MFVPEYYGMYRSGRGKFGCRQELLTVPQLKEPFVAQGEDPIGLEFPDLLSYDCPRCHEDHVFELREVYKVGSPRMQRLFLQDAEAKGMDLHVSLPEMD